MGYASDLIFIAEQMRSMVSNKASADEFEIVVEYSKNYLDLIKSMEKVEATKKQALDILNKYANLEENVND